MTRENTIPKRAIMRAISAGVAQAAPKASRRYHLTRSLMLAAIILIIGGGATTVTAASTGHLPPALQFLLPKTTKYYDNTDVQPTQKGNRRARTFTMDPGVEYVARKARKTDQQQVAPGFYDLTVTKGKYAKVMGILIPKGGTYHGYQLGVDNAVYGLNSGAQVRFTPAKLSPLEHVGNTYSTASPFGEYNVGTQLPAGFYRLHVQTKLAQYHVHVFYNVRIDPAKHHDTGGLSLNYDLTEKDAHDRVIQVVANTPLSIQQSDYANDATLPNDAGSITVQLIRVDQTEAKKLAKSAGMDANRVIE